MYSSTLVLCITKFSWAIKEQINIQASLCFVISIVSLMAIKSANQSINDKAIIITMWLSVVVSDMRECTCTESSIHSGTLQPISDIFWRSGFWKEWGQEIRESCVSLLEWGWFTAVGKALRAYVGCCVTHTNGHVKHSLIWLEERPSLWRIKATWLILF